MKPFLTSAFSSRLKEMRESKNLYQKDVADAVFISQPTYSGYENGRQLPNTEILFRLAGFFGVSADYLIGLSDRRGED